MKTVTYPLRLTDKLYRRVRREADRRQKKLSELFREIIGCGLRALPPMQDTSPMVADTWERLGPPPEIDYDKLRILGLGLPG